MAEYIEKDKAINTVIEAFADGRSAFIALEAIPAADVAPVVRGKWVNYGDEYRPDIRCCVCGQRKPILLGNFNFNFCSNCGADMREVDNA